MDEHRVTPTPDLDADPILGDALANYPSDRLRLLLIGGAVYAVAAVVLNTAFLPLDAETASIIVIGAMAVLGLGIGWVVLHAWNLEVVLYAHGFSYREGSRVAYLPFAEIARIYLRLERKAYFGGLLRRNIRQMTLQTAQGETLVLDTRYRRVEELIARLEREITVYQRRAAQIWLSEGGQVVFGGGLAVAREGLVVDGRALPWADFAGYTVGGGRLIMQNRAGEDWAAVSLDELFNLALLVQLLQEGQR